MSFVRYGSVAALVLLAACGGGNEQAAQVEKLPFRQGDNLTHLADSSRAAGDARTAEKLYLNAIAQAPDNPDPYLALANLYQSHGESMKAVSLLEEGVAKQKESPALTLPLANLLISNGENTKALKYARTAAKLTPENPRAFNTLGVALDNAGKYEEAQSAYETALRLDIDNSGYIQNNLALSYIMSDNYGEAIDILKPMAESKESSQTVRGNLALAYGLKGDMESAKEWMLKDLPEDKVSENIAFIQSYSKKRLAVAHTTSSTAVESVAVNDLDMPEDLLDNAKPVQTTKPKQFAAVPIFKPQHIVKNDVAVATPAPAAPEKVVASESKKPLPAPLLKPESAKQVAKADIPAVKDSPKPAPAVIASASKPIVKDEFDEDYVEDTSPARTVKAKAVDTTPAPKVVAAATPARTIKDEFDEDYVDDVIASKDLPKLRAVEPAAGVVTVEKSSHIEAKALPAPAFKPAR